MSILLRFVNFESKPPVTTIASIEPLETPDANGVFTAIKRGLQVMDINVESSTKPVLAGVNMDGASVNMVAKNGVARKLADCVDHPVIITHLCSSSSRACQETTLS